MSHQPLEIRSLLPIQHRSRSRPKDRLGSGPRSDSEVGSEVGSHAVRRGSRARLSARLTGRGWCFPNSMVSGRGRWRLHIELLA